MRKISDRDINFVLNAAILALIIMAILQAIAPLVSPPDERQPEITAYTKNIMPLRPVELEKKLHTKDKRPTMLVIYTTWCGYCRMLVPSVLELKKQNKLRNINLLFMSLDGEKEALSRYIIHNNYKDVLTPYIIKSGTAHELPGVLSMTGSNFKGSIPYVGVYNHEGKLEAELFGMVGKDALLDAVKKAK